jgi:hypothetical protein
MQAICKGSGKPIGNPSNPDLFQVLASAAAATTNA